MLTKRIIPCLDVRNRLVTKGVKFQNNVDIGDPIEMAVAYSDGGCDELVFYDITASAERRRIDIAMVSEVARVIHIPFSVGGGITGRSLYKNCRGGRRSQAESCPALPNLSRAHI